MVALFIFAMASGGLQRAQCLPMGAWWKVWVTPPMRSIFWIPMSQNLPLVNGQVFMELGNAKKFVRGNFDLVTYRHRPDPLILHLVVYKKAMPKAAMTYQKPINSCESE